MFIDIILSGFEANQNKVKNNETEKDIECQ